MPISTAANNPSTDRLSTTRPRKPLMSPGTSRKYECCWALVTKVEQGCVAARRRGVDSQGPLVRESREIMRAAGLGTGSGESVAAEGLHTDNGANHIAVDVGISDRGI